MKSLSIFLILIIPHTLLADCILTESPYKVVCSGYNPMSPPTDSKKMARLPKKSGKSKKVRFEERADTASNIVMNEEELQFMLARNKMDGYRGKRKPKEQIAKK